MAEIRVEPKNNNNNSIWPWIIGALILIGVIWGVAELLESDPVEPEVAAVETTAIEEEPVVNTVVAEGDIREYIVYVENEARTPDMGLDHQYTSEGIMKLENALSTLVNQQASGDVEIEQKRQTLEQAANKIQQDPQSLQHANTIQDAFMAAANLIDALQEKNYPNLNSQVDQVMQTAQSIDVNQQTLDQKDKVKQFFEQSAEAIEAMANR